MRPLAICFLAIFPYAISLAQNNFTENVKQYITYERGNYLLQNLTIVDGTGTNVILNQDIWIEGNRIKQVGVHLKPSKDVEIIDMTGKSAIPGLVMLHEHMIYPKSTPEPFYGVDQMSYSFPKLYLAGGVTTMRTAGGIMPQSDVTIKKWINEGKILGPKIDVTSPHMDREGAPLLEMFTFNTKEQAKKQIEFYAALGITSIKVYNFITREDLNVIIDVAHAHNMKVNGHLCSITYREATELGIDNIKHGFASCPDFLDDKQLDECSPFMLQPLLSTDPNSKSFTDLVQFMIQKNVALTTTVNVFEPYTGYEVVPGDGLRALSPNSKEKVYKRWIGKQGKDSIDIMRYNKLKVLDKKFHDMGGLLVAGTDPTYDGRIVAGYANMRLVEILAEMDFTIPQAIMICTLNGAKYLELDESIGTIEAGKIADLVIMDDDISKDISAIRSQKIVFKEGVGYNSSKLFEATDGLVGIR